MSDKFVHLTPEDFFKVLLEEITGLRLEVLDVNELLEKIIMTTNYISLYSLPCQY